MRGMVGMPERHPEQREGEMLLGNFREPTIAIIGYQSKRVGRIAYGAKGEIVPGHFPVFVNEEEFDERARAVQQSLTERYRN